jgi:hypothetical protein
MFPTHTSSLKAALVASILVPETKTPRSSSSTAVSAGWAPLGRLV